MKRRRPSYSHGVDWLEKPTPTIDPKPAPPAGPEPLVSTGHHGGSSPA